MISNWTYGVDRAIFDFSFCALLGMVANVQSHAP